ncbi:MAG: BACON domain-containing carbohydrate-binding protein [Rikenellaceae bacterium]
MKIIEKALNGATLLLATLCFALLLGSCTENEIDSQYQNYADKFDEYTITAGVDEEIPYDESDNYIISIASNKPWSIEVSYEDVDSEDWCTLSAYSSGEIGLTADVTIYAAANTSNESRKAFIAVSLEGVEEPTLYTIVQSGFVAELSASAAGNDLAAIADASTTFTIYSNTDWEITDASGKYTFEPSTGSGDTIVTAMTTSANTTQENIVTEATISAEDVDDVTVTLTQLFVPASLVIVDFSTLNNSTYVGSAGSVSLSEGILTITQTSTTGSSGSTSMTRPSVSNPGDFGIGTYVFTIEETLLQDDAFFTIYLEDDLTNRNILYLGANAGLSNVFRLNSTVFNPTISTTIDDLRGASTITVSILPTDGNYDCATATLTVMIDDTVFLSYDHTYNYTNSETEYSLFLFGLGTVGGVTSENYIKLSEVSYLPYESGVVIEKLEIDTSTMGNIPANGGSVSFSIKETTSDWSIAEVAGLTISPMSGTASESAVTVTVSAGANTTDGSISHSVVVTPTSEGTTLTAETVSISQLYESPEVFEGIDFSIFNYIDYLHGTSSIADSGALTLTHTSTKQSRFMNTSNDSTEYKFGTYTFEIGEYIGQDDGFISFTLDDSGATSDRAILYIGQPTDNSVFKIDGTVVNPNLKVDIATLEAMEELELSILPTNGYSDCSTATLTLSIDGSVISTTNHTKNNTDSDAPYVSLIVGIGTASASVTGTHSITINSFNYTPYVGVTSSDPNLSFGTESSTISNIGETFSIDISTYDITSIELESSHDGVSYEVAADLSSVSVTVGANNSYAEREVTLSLIGDGTVAGSNTYTVTQPSDVSSVLGGDTVVDNNGSTVCSFVSSSNVQGRVMTSSYYGMGTFTVKVDGISLDSDSSISIQNYLYDTSSWYNIELRGDGTSGSTSNTKLVLDYYNGADSKLFYFGSLTNEEINAITEIKWSVTPSTSTTDYGTAGVDDIEINVYINGSTTPLLTGYHDDFWSASSTYAMPLYFGVRYSGDTTSYISYESIVFEPYSAN